MVNIFESFLFHIHFSLYFYCRFLGISGDLFNANPEQMFAVYVNGLTASDISMTFIKLKHRLSNVV